MQLEEVTQARKKDSVLFPSFYQGTGYPGSCSMEDWSFFLSCQQCCLLTLTWKPSRKVKRERRRAKAPSVYRGRLRGVSSAYNSWLPAYWSFGHLQQKMISVSHICILCILLDEEYSTYGRNNISLVLINTCWIRSIQMAVNLSFKHINKIINTSTGLKKLRKINSLAWIT